MRLSSQASRYVPRQEWSASNNSEDTPISSSPVAWCGDWSSCWPTSLTKFKRARRAMTDNIRMSLSSLCWQLGQLRCVCHLASASLASVRIKSDRNWPREWLSALKFESCSVSCWKQLHEFNWGACDAVDLRWLDVGIGVLGLYWSVASGSLGVSPCLSRGGIVRSGVFRRDLIQERSWERLSVISLEGNARDEEGLRALPERGS